MNLQSKILIKLLIQKKIELAIHGFIHENTLMFHEAEYANIPFRAEEILMFWSSLSLCPVKVIQHLIPNMFLSYRSGHRARSRSSLG